MLNLKGINNNKPTLSLKGLNKTSATKSSISKIRKKKSRFRKFEPKDEVLSIYNENGVNISPFIKERMIKLIKGTTPKHYKEAYLLSKEYYEIFFEVYNEEKEHIGYGVQLS